jgi:replicative DNA helicase
MVYDRVREILRPDDFYAMNHQKLFQHMAAMIESGKTADGVTLAERFTIDGNFTGERGSEYLGQLLDAAVFGSEITDYCRMIAGLSARRAIIFAADEMRSTAFTPRLGETPQAMVEAARGALQDVEDRNLLSSGSMSAADAADQTFDEATATVLQPTGLRSLDRELGGFEPGAVSIVAGRPGIGKTAFAIVHMAKVAAEGSSVGILSADMSPAVVRQRLAFYLASVANEETPFFSEMRKPSSPWITPEFRERMKAHLRSDVGQQFLIDGRGGMSISAVSAQVRAWKMNCARRGLPPLRLVVLDHIAKFMPTQRANSLYEKTSYAMNELLDVAKQHPEIVFVALCQLNRANEADMRRPLLRDLRDSGKLEEDASAILLLHREDHYLSLTAKNQQLPEEERAAAQSKLNDVRGIMEAILPKNRNGEPSVVTLSHVIGKNIIKDKPYHQEGML